MLIKYVGEGDKKTQANDGSIYVFNKQNAFTCEVPNKELAEHLLNKCGGRFTAIGKVEEAVITPQPEHVEVEEVKKKRGRRKVK